MTKLLCDICKKEISYREIHLIDFKGSHKYGEPYECCADCAGKVYDFLKNMIVKDKDEK